MSRHGPYRSAPHQSIHRNLWTQGHVYCSDSRSTHSSGSSHTYHVLQQQQHQQPLLGQPGAQQPLLGHQGAQQTMEQQYLSLGPFYHEPEAPPPPPPQPPLREAVVGYRGCGAGRSGQDSKQMLTRTLPRSNAPNVQTELVLDNGRRSRPVSSRALTPVSGGADPPVSILPCGGHCVPLENFCHYFLQVAFLGGVLSGLCLVIVGSVFRRDLEVLTYIGSLTALVSGVLLWVQCLVRKGGQARPPRRMPQHQHAQTQHHHQRHQHHHQCPAQLHHHHHHHQQPPPEHIPLHHLQLPPPILRTTDAEFREESGIPWWRRENMVD